MNSYAKNPLDIALVWMPCAQLQTPSIALSLLKAESARAGLAARVVYSNHRLVERLGYEAYKRIERSLRYCVMSWEILFAPFAGFRPRMSMYDLFGIMKRELNGYFAARGVNDDTDSIVASVRADWDEIVKAVPAYLEAEAEYLISLNPKIVGFSIMTQQRNASLALMKAIKRRRPEIVTILGGGICAGKTAFEFLRVAKQIDYVFSGEGDTTFGEGCGLIIDGKTDELHARFPEFAYRGGKEALRITKDLNQMALPDYDDYFEQLKNEDFGEEIHPSLLVEGSRGCWWGEKGRCNFCGLHFNKETLKYREKSPETVWREIRRQAARYDCHNALLTDCVLSRDFIKSLPDTTNDGLRVNIFGECKSNLTEGEVIRLGRAGFTVLQPGIESLHDGPLELMHKGNRAIKHIELLKFGREHGVKMTWNILMALPGEKPEWYEEMLRRMSLIHHLDPPSNVWPMILMRCSVYQEQAEAFGIRAVLPQLIYSAMDPDDEEFTRETAVFLRTGDIPVDADMVRRMNEEALNWRGDYKAGARLVMRERPGGISVTDERNPDETKSFELTGARAKVYALAWSAVRLDAVHDKLDGEYGAENVSRAIASLDGERLAVVIDGEMLALANVEKEKT